MKKEVLFLIVFVSLIYLGSASTPISSCPYTISSPGEYYLTESLTATVTCITINSNNVTLDLMGFNISGNDDDRDTGIVINSNNSIIKNGSIYDLGIGIEVSGRNDSLIDLVINSSDGDGISFGGSFGNITNVISNYNGGNGIYISGESNFLMNSYIYKNLNYGLSLSSSSNNTFQNFYILSSTSPGGLLIDSSSNNTFQNLTCTSLYKETSSYGIRVTGDSNNNSFFNISTILNSEGISISSGADNHFYNVSTSLNIYGMSISSDNNSFFDLNISLNRYGILLSASNNNFTYLNLNSNSEGLKIQNSNSTLFDFINVSQNTVYGIDIDSSYYNNFSNVNFSYNSIGFNQSLSDSFLSNSFFIGNLIPSLIKSNLFDANYQRSYNLNQNLRFNFNLTYINGTFCTNCAYNFSIYPSLQNNYSFIDGNLSINFTPTKEGIHSLVLNVTTPEGVYESSKVLFLVGNFTNSSIIRFYMHEDNPTHGQAVSISGTDSGSMFSYPTISDEVRSCGTWVQFQPDEVFNYPFIIQNISVGWVYNGTGTYSRIQKYVDYSGSGDLSVIIPSSEEFVFNITNFTNLNITSDYSWRQYFLSFKISTGGGNPFVKSNATQQSYADFTYLYTGPKIEEFREMSSSDIREIQFLSNVFNNDNRTNATLEFEGEGNFTITINMSDGNYEILYDGVSCNDNSNCTINSNNSEGDINLTLNLGSYHYLDLYIPLAGSSSEENLEGNSNSDSTSGAYPIYYLNETQLNEGYSKDLGKNYKYIFNFENENHSLKVNSISTVNKTVNLTISSVPQTKVLSLGEIWQVDLNLDSIYDFEIKFLNLKGAMGNISIQKLVYLESQENSNNQTNNNVDSGISEVPGNTTTRLLKIYFDISLVLGGLAVLIWIYFLIKQVLNKRESTKI